MGLREGPAMVSVCQVQTPRRDHARNSLVGLGDGADDVY